MGISIDKLLEASVISRCLGMGQTCSGLFSGGDLLAWLTRHPEVVYTDLEEGAVLLHLDTKYYYSLNEVGRTIWRLLDSAESLEGLIQKVTAEYDIEEEHAQGSVPKFLQELEREQLVYPQPAAKDASAPDERAREGSAGGGTPSLTKRPFSEPELIKHDEPLHEVVMNPFDPQLPLAE